MLGHSILRQMILSKEIFPNPSITQGEVDSLISSDFSKQSKYELVQFLFLTAKFSKKKNKTNKILIVQSHLRAIEVCLRRFPPTSWKGKEVSFIINSLQIVRSTNPGINKFLYF
jgi:hypothetical protein